MALIGGVLTVFAAGGLLLRTPYFAATVRPVPAPRGAPAGLPWWLTALVTTAIPALTFFWFNDLAIRVLPPSALFPQAITNGIMLWALLNGLITLVLLTVWHVLGNRKQGIGTDDYGLTVGGRVPWRTIGRSAVLAVASVGVMYALLLLSDLLFLTDYRFWVLQWHVVDAAHLRLFLTYLLPFTAFFLVLGAAVTAQLRRTGRATTRRRELVGTSVTLSAGILLLVVVSYVPLLAGGTLLLPTQPLLIIVAFQFIPILAIVGALQVFFFHSTGTIYAGSFASALLVTWNVTAGTATQFEFGAWDAAGMFVRVWLPLLVGVVLLVTAVRQGRRADPPTTVRNTRERERVSR